VDSSCGNSGSYRILVCSYGRNDVKRVQLEGVWSGAGALLPLDPAVALVGPHAVLVVLILEHLVAIVVVLDGVGYPSEVLDTVRGGSPRRIAGDLPDEDVPVVSARGQGVGQCDGVTGHSSELHVHVVACVGAAYSGRVDTSLTGSLKTVGTDSNPSCGSVHFEAIEGLEVKPVGYIKRKFEINLLNYGSENYLYSL